MKETAVYIHIPFCDHKCIYCDFYSITKSGDAENYLISLEKEMEYYAAKFSRDRIITTIFFGGGTPSLMHPKYIGAIISKLSKYFNLNENLEITLETNPGTVNKKKIQNFLIAGVNRFSIGIQSFDNNELKFLTRIHNSQEAVKTVEQVYAAGCENISVDLIFNLPGQSKAIWERNLISAVSLPIKHISAYSLILERGTILNKMVFDGKVKIQGEDYDADLYEMTINFLTGSGFRQYEVSNFAKPGFECMHNLAYWAHKEYFGLGTSAHSFIEGKRWWNFSSLKMYNEAIRKNGNAIRNSEELSENEMLEEIVMLSFRSEGLNKKEIIKEYGDKFFNKNISYIRNLIAEGYLTDHKNVLHLTKEGYLVCDEIIANLLTNI